MSDAASSLETLAERFAHPAARVMARELTHLARDLERGTLAWPRVPPIPARPGAALPGLESIEAALSPPRPERTLAVDQSDWAGFARVVLALPGLPFDKGQPPPGGEPHPAALIALRLVWGAERFSELPTVILKPPPAAFLEHLARLPAPERDTASAQLDQTASQWLQEKQPAQLSGVPPTVADVRGFARVVAACRVVGQMRQALALEDVAVGYLAWARVLRANPEQLSAISSGWWSSTERQPGRQPRR